MKTTSNKRREKKIIMLKGMPASGKSTWTYRQITKNRQFKAVSKDYLRAMFDNRAYSKDRERFICKVRDAFIKIALDEGFSVIIDDTNMNPIHEKQLRKIAKINKVGFEIKSFLGIPLKTLIKRDKKRPIGDGRVGAKAITEMYNDFIK